jgi:hypothetical protein
MKCSEFQEKIADFLTHEIDPGTKQRMEAHLAECNSCGEEICRLSAIWNKLGVLPLEQPSPGLRDRFYTMLEAYKQGMEQKETFPAPGVLQTFKLWAGRLWPKRPAFQFGLALLFLAVGLTGGFLLNPGKQGNAKIVQLERQVENMQQTVAVALLNQPSPSDRLQGVTWSYELKNPSEKTLAALLATLDSDPNINVRLAAIDALYLFYKHPGVKEGILRSLPKQSSPLVQVALIDLLVEIRERRAADAFHELIQNEQLAPEVKERARLAIQKLS